METHFGLNDLAELSPQVNPNAIVRFYDNELVAWSPTSHDPTSLDAVASVVYQMLDGTATVAELAVDIHEVVGVSESVAQNQLRRVITQLGNAGLLEDPQTDEDLQLKEDFFPAPPNP